MDTFTKKYSEDHSRAHDSDKPFEPLSGFADGADLRGLFTGHRDTRRPYTARPGMAGNRAVISQGYP